jgi:HNH endonuclease
MKSEGLKKRWPQRTLQQRFDEKWIPEPNSGCWLWLGASTEGDPRYDYGVIRVEGRTVRAHRVSYELARGPVPNRLELDHICRNSYCVNPDHLEAVTHEENLRRAPAFQGTHCKNCGTVLVSRWKRHDGKPRKECPKCVSDAKKRVYRKRKEYSNVVL